MIPAIVFIDDDLDVTFAPRVPAFRGDARVDDVTALHQRDEWVRR
jgi:hypothetical protein